jgi:hypothetical protein
MARASMDMQLLLMSAAAPFAGTASSSLPPLGLESEGLNPMKTPEMLLVMPATAEALILG